MYGIAIITTNVENKAFRFLGYFKKITFQNNIKIFKGKVYKKSMYD